MVPATMFVIELNRKFDRAPEFPGSRCSFAIAAAYALIFRKFSGSTA
jgi:hypothetical protein